MPSNTVRNIKRSLSRSIKKIKKILLQTKKNIKCIPSKLTTALANSLRSKKRRSKN